MTRARFRIKTVSIEGFRGFTKPQTIDIGGQNVFVFGPNGLGKSSVVEAIRWCLFGSPAGRDIEVRNTFYAPGECRVTLVLARKNGELQIQRELRPGATRSRQTIRDATGDVVLERDVLPQLARIGHQQGTQVIFAAQQAAGRQSQVDISDFTRVLCFYLNLEAIPDLLDRLRQLLEERQVQAEQMAKEIEQSEDACRQGLGEVDARLSELLRYAPWGDGPAPTGQETVEKVAEFVRSQARSYEKEPPNSAPGNALATVRRWIDESMDEATDKLNDALQALTEKHQRAEGVLREFEAATFSFDAVNAQQERAKESLGGLLRGRSIEELQQDLEQLEAAMTELAARAEIARRAEKLCTDYHTPDCPICGSQLGAEELLLAVRKRLGENEQNTQDADSADALRKTIEEAVQTREAIAESERQVAELRGTIDRVRKELCRALGVDDATADQARMRMNELVTDISNVTQRIDDADARRERCIKAVKDLQAELRYHEHRDQVEQLRWRLGAGLDEARGILQEYRELLAATGAVTRLLDDAFNEALDRAIPPLNEMMTDVYSRLTRQVSYDQIEIVRNEENPSRRELRVAASRLVGQTFPINVLNGQAAKALQLVPYFVFSRFQPEVMELDLLLIDDPSESFDTSHVGCLMEELGEAAHHAQLIVATHEQEKFERHMTRCFTDEPYKVIGVVDFDPIEGPKLAY